MLRGSVQHIIIDDSSDSRCITNAETSPCGSPQGEDGATRIRHAVPSAVRSMPKVQGRLKERHIAMIALAGMLGTGLFLTSGVALADAGPLGSLIGYVLMGIVTTCGTSIFSWCRCSIYEGYRKANKVTGRFLVAFTAAEMSAFCPATGGFIVHTQKFVNPALGAATGWNFAYALATVQAVEIVAATVLTSFWTSRIPAAVLITGFWIGMVSINLMPVQSYGEAEFIFGLLKISLVVGLIIIGLIIDLGKAPNHERLGLRYWKEPFRELAHNGATIHGFKGKFLGVWSTLVNAAFAFAHVQVVAIAGKETHNPRISIPAALSRTAYRILFLYIGVIFILGLIVPASHPGLHSDTGTATSSPFVIAAREAGISSIASVINAIVLTSAFSSGSASIFISSRSLVALADDNHAPKALKRTNKYGVPYVAVLLASSLGSLAYLSISEDAMRALMWLVNLSSVAGLVSWCILCVGYLRVLAGLKAQGYSRSDLPYRSPFQPYIAWFALVSCLLVLVFSGFRAFLGNQFDVRHFLSNYLNIFFFLSLYVGWKLFTGSSWSWIKAHELPLRHEFRMLEAESQQEETEILLSPSIHEDHSE